MRRDKKGIMDILEMAKSEYRVFTPENEEYCWGYIVTEHNVLNVYYGDFGGYTFDLEYIPSRQHGSGCRCGTVDDVTLETIKEMEESGIRYANKLRAQRYDNPMDFFKNYWTKIVEL